MLFDYGFDLHHYQYTNFNGEFYKRTSGPYDYYMATGSYESFLKSTNPKPVDTTLYRTFWRNPLAFWRYYSYFGKQYSFPYISENEIRENQKKYPVKNPFPPGLNPFADYR